MILEQKLQILTEEFYKKRNPETLKEISQTYLKLNRFNDRFDFGPTYGFINAKQPSYEISKAIMDQSKSLPIFIVSLAEAVCRKHANKSVKPVGEIAAKNKWFVNS